MTWEPHRESLVSFVSRKQREEDVERGLNRRDKPRPPPVRRLSVSREEQEEMIRRYKTQSLRAIAGAMRRDADVIKRELVAAGVVIASRGSRGHRK